MIKLNIGCGNDYVAGYINIDRDSNFCNNGVDLIADMRQLPYEANSVDEIRAEGCLEHLSYRDVIPTLYHWFSILKPGGQLIIETPNLMRVLSDVLKDGHNINGHAYETLYGGQRNETEYHAGLWSLSSLALAMGMVGFVDVESIKPTKNLESGEDWNIRLVASKWHEWSYPGLSK